MYQNQNELFEAEMVQLIHQAVGPDSTPGVAPKLQLGLLHVRSASDIGLDQPMGLVDGKENVRFSKAILVLNAALLLQWEGEVVNVRHGQIDL